MWEDSQWTWSNKEIVLHSQYPELTLPSWSAADWLMMTGVPRRWWPRDQLRAPQVASRPACLTWPPLLLTGAVWEAETCLREQVGDTRYHYGELQAEEIYQISRHWVRPLSGCINIISLAVYMSYKYRNWTLDHNNHANLKKTNCSSLQSVVSFGMIITKGGRVKGKQGTMILCKH